MVWSCGVAGVVWSGVEGCCACVSGGCVADGVLCAFSPMAALRNSASALVNNKDRVCFFMRSSERFLGRSFSSASLRSNLRAKSFRYRIYFLGSSTNAQSTRVIWSCGYLGGRKLRNPRKSKYSLRSSLHEDHSATLFPAVGQILPSRFV